MEIFEKVAAIIADQFGIDESTITRDTSFEGDLGADSLDIVELTMSIEEEFDVGEIEEGDLESIRTVGSVVDMISAKLAG